MTTDTLTQALSLESGFDEWYDGRPYARGALNPQGYARMVWRAASKHRAALAAAEAQPLSNDPLWPTDGLYPDMQPPATSRDRWMFDQGRLAERRIAQPVAVPQGMTPMDAVYRAMDMASLLAGAVARGDTHAADARAAALKSHLLEHICKPPPVAAAPAAPAPALVPQGLPDPLGCNACTHPSCGRYDGPRSVECRAMADNACARPTERADGIGGEA